MNDTGESVSYTRRIGNAATGGLDVLRNKLGVPETDTIAAGKTDVKVTGKSNFVIQNGQYVE